MTPTESLEAIFDADRRARAAESELLDNPGEGLADALVQAIADAFGLEDQRDGELRLRRLADLCAQVEGPKMADALISILDHSSAAVRTEAGESLLDVAFSRFKEVARAIERALDRKHEGPAMQELPFVLAEVRDPDPIPLIARFLGHPNPAVVGAAIEAIAGYGDPSAARHLQPLLSDQREAALDDLDGPQAKIGELAEAALEELGYEP